VLGLLKKKKEKLLWARVEFIGREEACFLPDLFRQKIVYYRGLEKIGEEGYYEFRVKEIAQQIPVVFQKTTCIKYPKFTKLLGRLRALTYLS
jgi:hypothetical protein